jgi:hypothetical protein
MLRLAPGEAAVGCILGLWALASLLALIERCREPIRLYDVLFLIPEWKFFAPVPGQWDFHLLYRDRLGDGSITEWTEVVVGNPRRWWNAFWNPRKRGKKAVLDAVVGIAYQALAQKDAIPLSPAFLTLLNHISSLPRPEASHFTQFTLIRFHPDSTGEPPDVAFVSAFHAL